MRSVPPTPRYPPVPDPEPAQEHSCPMGGLAFSPERAASSPFWRCRVRSAAVFLSKSAPGCLSSDAPPNKQPAACEDQARQSGAAPEKVPFETDLSHARRSGCFVLCAVHESAIGTETPAVQRQLSLGKRTRQSGAQAGRHAVAQRGCVLSGRPRGVSKPRDRPNPSNQQATAVLGLLSILKAPTRYALAGRFAGCVSKPRDRP